MRKDDEIRNWQETETETERIVKYETPRAKVTVHIPKRTPEEQERYEKNVRAALRRFYYDITAQGLDWDELVEKNRKKHECS